MTESGNARLDDAARAGWLYYIAGRTQDEIARSLNVSRPTAQRLVSLCRAENLITFRMTHPIGACMELAARLAERHRLLHCDIVPADGTRATSFTGMAEAAAIYLERMLRSGRSLAIALGTGRSMRASVERVAPAEYPLHRLISLVGNISPDGSASRFDAPGKLADITGAQYFPMPLPLHAATPEQRDQMLAIDAVRRIFALAADADIRLSGISQIDHDAVFLRDGFITRDELFDSMRLGGVGEVIGWIFDRDGRILDQGLNCRVTSVAPHGSADRPHICVACGADKVVPLHAALIGGLVNGLVTDETTARMLLAC